MSKKLSLTIPEKMDEKIEELVEKGVFSSKTGVIEEGLRLVFMRYSGFRYQQLSDRVGEVMND